MRIVKMFFAALFCSAVFWAASLILFIFHGTAKADPLSNHNEPHAGIQAAIDRLDAAGCARYQITRSGQYVLSSTQDANAYELTGNTITISCTRPARQPVVYHRLTWRAPTTRTDKTPLHENEISHYEIETFAGIINVGRALEYTMGDVGTVPRTYRIRMVETSGQLTSWSPEVVIE